MTSGGIFRRRKLEEMEQFLNLLWLVIVLVAAVVWSIGREHQRHGSHFSSLQEAAGLGCAFLLLFFAISMTDDLYPDLVIIEGGDQRHSILHSGPDRSSPSERADWATSTAILPTCIILEPLRTSDDVPSEVEVFHSVIKEPLSPGRSPPLSSL